MTAALQTLLELQDQDIAIDQLAHRRDHLEARAQYDAVLVEAKQIMPQHAVLTKRLATITAEEKRLDDEAQSQRDKAERVNTKLYSGTVSATKELQALQVDFDAIRAHISTLEDHELEIMDKREAVEAELQPVNDRLDTLQREVQRCQAAIAAGESEIEAALISARARRDEIAAMISPVLVTDYETRRAQNKGQGAARLLGDTCQGCRLSVPATELDSMRMDTSDTPWYCDNCGAILVITPA